MSRLAGPAESRYISSTMCRLSQTQSFFPAATLALAGLLLRGRAR
jgi:hypothetical protein